MKPATVAQMTVRICGLVLIVLGVMIWTGRFDQLIPIHRLIGILLVLALWALCYFAARAGVPAGLVAGAFVWGLVAPVLGLTQEGILTGSYHWVIQVLHLLIGLGVIGWGERLGRAIKSGSAAPARAA